MRVPKGDFKAGKSYSYEELKAEWAKDDQWQKDYPYQAFFRNLYYRVRAFVYNIPDMPRDAYRTVKRGLQRGWRGWADEDVWGLFAFHARVTYAMLLRLKETKHGIPLSAFPESAKTREDGNFTDEEEAKAVENWNKILDRMIYAYKLNVDIANGDRENYMPHLSEEQRREFNCLTQREDCERRIGMLLFDCYYFNLWD
jgi:hypothetical protein